MPRRTGNPKVPVNPVHHHPSLMFTMAIAKRCAFKAESEEIVRLAEAYGNLYPYNQEGCINLLWLM
jgi:hypothetical protein